MVRSIPHLHSPPSGCDISPEPCASRDHDVYRIHVGSLRPKHMSRHRILIVKLLSYVIASINHRLLSVAISLIYVYPITWAICNDLSSLEAVTFIFPGNRMSQLMKKKIPANSRPYHSRISIKHDVEIGIETERRENTERAPSRYSQTL